MYAPTWDTELSIEEQRKRVMTGDYTGVKIVPLLVDDTDPMAELTRDIFPARPDVDHLQLAKCVLWPRSGEPCVPIPFPTRNGKSYPHGTFLDTQSCPLELIHPLCLRQYLQVRGVRLKQKEDKKTLRRLFRRARHKRMKPMDLDTWNKYRDRPNYYASTPFKYVRGTRNTSVSSTVRLLKKMQVTQESIVRDLGCPNEVYKRAIRRLKDGHIDVKSFHSLRAVRNDTKENIDVLCVEVSASLRDKMHSVRLGITDTGIVLPAPYTSCSCEVGGLDCAHVGSIHLSSLHVKNCVRLWGHLRPDEEPLSDQEILSLFPPLVILAQRIPCRAQHLARRAFNSNSRSKASLDVVFNTMTELHGDTDDETDEEDSGKNVPLRLDRIILSWSSQMLKIDDDDSLPDRPRVVSNAHLGTQEMEDDVKNYIKSFPLNRQQQFEQDYTHELEYRAMYQNEIPRNNNWGFYLYKTARERQERIRSYIADTGGANLKVSVIIKNSIEILTHIITTHR